MTKKYDVTRYFVLALATLVLLVAGCAEFVEVDTPKNEITGAVAYKDDGTATAAVVGIYAKMSESVYFNTVGIPMLTGLSADEFINTANFGAFEENQLLPTQGVLVEYLWQPGYKYIYYANAVLEGLAKSKGVSGPVRASLQGQAYFVRAMCYFYLVNLFGPLPKVTSTDYEINAFLPRLPVDSIYALIDHDLANAVALLPKDFATSRDEERTLPTNWAAHALWARAALYRGQWAKAAFEADSVIIQETMFQLPLVEEVFNYNSPEAIWQIKAIFIPQGTVTLEALTFIYSYFVYLRPSLVEALEVGDGRAQWILPLDETLSVPYKYRYASPDEGIEYHIEFRLAEQYLIRAEARAQLGDLDGAVSDLDMIRARAGLPQLSEMDITWTRELLLERVMQERRIELFSEGHRWFDLIRTGQAGAVLGTIAGKKWDDKDILYPIPQSEINKNPNLEKVN